MSERTPKRGGRKALSLDEIDKMEVFPAGNPECFILCEDLQNTLDELDDTTGLERRRLIARLRALSARLRALHCPPCLPQ